MKKILTLLIFSLLFVGCDNKKTAEELFQDCSSGVVVILAEFYYEASLPNGKSVYFTGVDEKGNVSGLTLSAEEASRNPCIITGTGFFVDNEGTLMTNRHVAQPGLDEVTARKAMLQLMNGLRQLYAARMMELTSRYDALENSKNECTYYDFNSGSEYQDNGKLMQIEQQQTELREQYNELQSACESISNNMYGGIRIKTVCKMGIAYNNTYVSSPQDFILKNGCNVVRVSDKEDVDLALIQLKTRKTPETAYVFDVKGDRESTSLTDQLKGIFAKDDGGKIKIDQQLYMIGYNAGMVLANTKQGIKVQMTSGKVTQLPDNQRLLYSIPTLPGSSGSPVIDECGRVVAVNFAKLGTTDNFNFGIPENRIKEFMNAK